MHCVSCVSGRNLPGDAVLSAYLKRHNFTDNIIKRLTLLVVLRLISRRTIRSFTFTFYFTLVKEALIEIGCVVTSLVVGWLVVTHVHCGQTVHPRPIVTMEH